MGLRDSRGSFVCLFVVLCCTASQVKTDPIGAAEPRLWPWDKFFEMMETMMDDMTQVILEGLDQSDDIITSGMSSMNNTILSLSDDILSMADKIGEMADRIGDMSLQIGIMADRIVQTEVLLADMALILSGHENSTIPIPPAGNFAFSPPSVVIYEPKDGENISISSPTLKTSGSNSSEMLLHFSENPTFPEAESFSILSDPNSISKIWERVARYHCKNQYIFMAITTISPDTREQTHLSNSVLLYC